MPALIDINWDRLHQNALAIRAHTGVPIMAVVKANAYGVGILPVSNALKDIADAFYVFDPREAIEARLWERTGKPTLALIDLPGIGADDYLRHHIRPAVWDVNRAKALQAARPILSVDTGQQRFACPGEQIDQVIRAGSIDEAFTHAVRLQQVNQFKTLMAGRGLKLHAAGSALLNDPSTWLDTVRPGLALYQNAVRVSSRLVDVKESRGPAGYRGFIVPRFGVIVMGYTDGLRPGPCILNGKRSSIIEVGMQSAFVETFADTKIGDEVILLGEGLTPQEVALIWNCSPQEALVQLQRSSPRI